MIRNSTTELMNKPYAKTGIHLSAASFREATCCPFNTINKLEKSILPRTKPITGMKILLTSDETILPKAAPIIIPTARSITFPLKANSLNS